MAVDMFIRVLDSIDSVVVDREVSRTEQQGALHTQLKDMMRLHSLDSIADAWYTILVTYETTNDVLVSSCLETIANYIHWIDIRLIVNERFVSLLFRLMSSTEQRQHACECFTSIVEKGVSCF